MKSEEYRLRRFNFGVDFGNQFNVEEDPDGKWVAWDDVKPLLQAYLHLMDLVNTHTHLKSEIQRIEREMLNADMPTVIGFKG